MSRPFRLLTEDTPGAAEPPALDLDRLMAELRAEVEARTARSESRPPPPAPAGRPCCDVRDLLGLPEAEFVAKAYIAILGREASPQEAGRAMDLLLLGEARPAAFLDALARSPEGRARGVEIKGLAQSRLRETPAIRAVVGLCRDVTHFAHTLYLLPRRIRQFVRRVDALEKRAADLATRVERLERRSDRADANHG